MIIKIGVVHLAAASVMIAAGRPLSARDVADALGVAYLVAYRALKRLEGLGLASGGTLTPKGLALLGEPAAAAQDADSADLY